MKKLSWYIYSIFAVFFGLIGVSFATGPDFTTITTGIDFSTVGPAILAVGVLLAGPIVVKRGLSMILAVIGRG